ncbi:AAA family ATPase [Vibrio sp. 10N.286.46.E10]|uniref:AAA family ATPase n=1 Tax=Vibrio sp. 10N.286.46.E10 TaxID=1884477 RepID=UPI001F52C5B8|nr:AAA family ATPase [Vibrio sp. 10N.286.46.E10]
MRLSKLHLKNFKVFEDIHIYPNTNFNIIIGENSAGKSTIFEGIHLWEKCYQAFILASKKGFYKANSSTSRYVNYQELDFLRITNDNDLFFHSGRDKCAEITLTLKIDELEYNLGFKVSRPTSISNAFFRIQIIEQQPFTSFAEKIVADGKSLDEAIFIYQTRPVAGILQYEQYHNDAQVKKKIQKGLSHEVLRNKIIAKRDTITELQERITSILGKTVEFELPPKTRARTDEFVSLKVSIGAGKKQDLHLQGSGFLQIVEILSTIEFLDAPLKLLLVDEPDSHIHTKLQSALIQHLRTIEHNQFFVISHNDQFVTNAGEDEVYFLSQQSKDDKELRSIKPESFDSIKRSLGGVILALESLHHAKHIAFVEGNDDAEYLKFLYSKIKTITDIKNCINEVSFFPLRGKDNITQKIEYNKRTLSSLLKGKAWNVIFDRDFSNNDVDGNLKNIIQGKGCNPFSHDGYCIESVLFSNIEILKRFIVSHIDHIDELDVRQHIDDVLNELQQQALDLNSELNIAIKQSFKGQKSNRPEFDTLDFDDVMRGWSDDGQFMTQRIMSKPLISKFVKNLEERVQFAFLLRSSNNDEEISSQLFLKYCDFIDGVNDVYPSFISLFQQIQVLEE